jgi:hypothetical protein
VENARRGALSATTHEENRAEEHRINFCLIPPTDSETREEKELSAALDLRCVVSSLETERDE